MKTWRNDPALYLARNERRRRRERARRERMKDKLVSALAVTAVVLLWGAVITVVVLGAA